VEFETSNLETAPAWPTQATRVADITIDTLGLLSSKFAARSYNNDWLDTRNAYTLSRVAEIKNTNLDGFMRCEVPSQVQSLDNQLQRLQSFFVLDAVAPWLWILLCHQML